MGCCQRGFFEKTVPSGAAPYETLIKLVRSLSLPGGLGEAVLAAVAQESGVTVRILAVTEVPRSGPGDELLEMFGISANHIVKAIRELNE